jgi:hypothetical protein
MDGDALYFRDLLIPTNHAIRAGARSGQLLKVAAFFEIYALNDCAAEIIVKHRETLAPHVDCDLLLDLLTPPHEGKRLPYRDYVEAYFAPDSRFVASSPIAADARQLAVQVEQLSGELRRVYGSNSWRITSPLRHVVQFLSRDRNRDPGA